MSWPGGSDGGATLENPSVERYDLLRDRVPRIVVAHSPSSFDAQLLGQRPITQRARQCAAQAVHVFLPEDQPAVRLDLGNRATRRADGDAAGGHALDQDAAELLLELRQRPGGKHEDIDR